MEGAQCNFARLSSAMSKRVSIIIPAFNVENYLGECVQSCVDLVNADACELIIVDNNSSDNTRAVAEQWREKFPHFIQVVTEMKKGAAAARNAGLALAQGEWVQLLDADDLLMPLKISRQLEIIDQSGQKPCFLAASYLRRKTDGRMIEKLVTPRSAALNLLWGYGACGITSSNLWNRYWLDQAGKFDESRTSSQETHMMFSLLKLNPVVVWDTEPLTIVRDRADGSQISSGKQEALTANFFALRKEMISWIESTSPTLLKKNKDITQRIYRSFSIWLLSEPKSAFHTETLSFLIDHLYTPWYQKGNSNPESRYNRERTMRKLRNSRINQKLQLIK